MKRMSLFMFVIAVASIATVAHAAQLTVVPDASSYAPGATITLTVTGTINPAAGDATTNIDVRLGFTNSSFVSSTADNALNPPPPFPPGAPPTPWTVGGTQGTLVGGEVTVFNQIQGLPPGGPFVNNCNTTFTDCFVTATVVMTAGSPGTADFDFGELTNFFDVQGASPGTSVTIVPEPGTAALMGLGLLGLAAAGRPRR